MVVPTFELLNDFDNIFRDTILVRFKYSLLLFLQVPSTYHLHALMSEPRLQPEGLPHIQGIFHFTENLPTVISWWGADVDNSIV